MSKISITYVGNKPSKKDTVTGSRLVFPKGKPVEVDEDIAYRLLDYPQVWVPSNEAEDVIKAQEAKAEELEKRKQAELERLANEAKANSVIAIVEGHEKDITKFTKKQLATLEVAHDLVIADESKTDTKAYRLAVRDELAKIAEKDGE